MSSQFSSLVRQQHRQFYLVVYTQTDAHVNHFICGGGLDLGLNGVGIDEAKKVARRFKKNPLKIKRIIGSPELRVVQMADIFHDEIKVKMALWKDFSDQVMGDWEGLPIDSKLDFKNPPRGETETAFRKRVLLATEKLLIENELALVVTHLRVARLILTAVGLDPQAITPGVMVSIDLPANDGNAHLRVI